MDDDNQEDNEIVMPLDHALGDDTDAEEEEDDADDPLVHLPGYVLRRVEKLQELDEQRDRIMDEYLKERAALQKKYEEAFKPLYEKRARIVKGELDEEIAQEVKEKSSAYEEQREPSPDDVKGIPQFWACTMTQMETVGELIAEEDVDCLEHLQDIQCTDWDDGKGFTLHFHFAPNEYFTNSVLTKQYEVPNLLLPDEPLLKSVKGTKIDWKPGKCITHKEVKKKQRGKEMPPMESMDEEEADRLEEIFDNDYEIAQAFRYHIVPKAVSWFSGKASDDEMNRVIESMTSNEEPA